jgi:hypothetical protein
MTIAEWIEAYRQAWEERDADAAAALFTEDATYRSLVFEEPHIGRTGIAEYWRGVTEAQSEVRVRMGKPYGSAERAAVEFWTNMKVGGEDVTLPGILLLEFTPDGLCSRLHEYWHYQPGVFDPPPEWGA